MAFRSLLWQAFNSLKVAFYLDSVTKHSGCLRVIPDTHNVGDIFGNEVQEVIPHPERPQHQELWDLTGPSIRSIPLESEPGDVLVFNHKIKHAAYGGNNTRRIFTIGFQERHPEHDLERLREELSDLVHFWQPRAYGKVMIETASPSRMRHFEQRFSLDSHMVELL